ncbi:MAG TPA: arginyltransferase [Rhodospirillaceae bacterium]|nr:arginyltransferase [Alphaproteobacteria bacterium]OUT42161.1 MAG: arginyltransferase [Micavibrio sp. TMED2]HCI46808.1 arginyltransferase [Rhodospirillaceae bacterium]MAS46223.1 arginyltransferase [Alphaproteobacteria bacterium]MAX95592.1 arginyltransferase [Alphaproteobacteria bacterium]|tara:strand:+ start:11340 stop:12143 length:804 start_codon:yes stop_codon:yes gene_type:complete
MSLIDRPQQPLLQFFRSGALPCPYIEGQIERKLFARLSATNAVAINASLTQAGFRRSHDIIYRPVCPSCSACIPVRIPTRDYKPTRSMRRILNRNEDLTWTLVPATATVEQYELFTAYQNARHTDSDMARMGLSDYVAMIDEGRANTELLEARTKCGRLIGAMLVDRLPDGFSAVYSFFDPDDDTRSLGNYLILCLIDLAQNDNLDFIYLGYWIENSSKMAYKTRFRPLEALGPNGWHELGDDDGNQQIEGSNKADDSGQHDTTHTD